MMRKFIFSVSFFLVTFVLFSLHAGELDLAQSEFNECLGSLPSKLSAEVSSGNVGKSNISGHERKKVKECLEKKRTVEDERDIIAISNDLQSLNKNKSSEMKKEADEIARIFVETTHELNKKFKMGRSSLFHNFLIKVGARQGGYCYQWADAILDKFPKKPYEFFERHWGVHKEATVLENNAIIITAKGEPIEKGIIYDPWRGRGRPYWIFVNKDSQDWSELFKEIQILTDQHK